MNFNLPSSVRSGGSGGSGGLSGDCRFTVCANLNVNDVEHLKNPYKFIIIIIILLRRKILILKCNNYEFMARDVVSYWLLLFTYSYNYSISRPINLITAENNETKLYIFCYTEFHCGKQFV